MESRILQKNELLKNTKDVQETDRLFAELETLEWLLAQIVVFILKDSSKTARGILDIPAPIAVASAVKIDSKSTSKTATIFLRLFELQQLFFDKFFYVF